MHDGLIIVTKVANLEWQKAAPDNPDLEVCPNNGGKRIFPGKIDPNDSPSPDPDIRRKVNLVVTIEPPIANVEVFAKVWDVDDPFDQLRGPNHSANVTQILNAAELDLSNPTSGPDNRPTAENPQILPPGFTDENGQVTWTLTVSMQPGNNYRAAASVIDEAVYEQIDQTDADAMSTHQGSDGKYYRYGGFSGYKVPVVWSQMLTVWRKLHVEADSMKAEPTSVMDRDPDWQDILVTDISIGSETSILFLANPLSGHSPHQYEGGRVKIIDNGLELSVIDHFDQSIEVDIVMDPAMTLEVIGKIAVIKDDDPDNGLLPNFITIDSFTKNAYKDAYIDIVNLEDLFNPNKEIDFDLYISWTEMLLGLGWNDSIDHSSSNLYWTSFVISAYQAGGDLFDVNGRDNDPDPFVDNSTYPSGPYWVEEEYNEFLQSGWTFDSGDRDSVVFRATIVDTPRYNYFESQVIAHEIGHSGGSIGTEVSHHDEGGLMREGLLESDTKFTGKTLKRFREAVKW